MATQYTHSKLFSYWIRDEMNHVQFKISGSMKDEFGDFIFQWNCRVN